MTLHLNPGQARRVFGLVPLNVSALLILEDVIEAFPST